MAIKIKRAYDQAEPADGMRVLVDRYWPRGLRKDEARIDLWAKEIAPSADLISWFGHKPERWPEFKARYSRELDRPEAQHLVETLVAQARSAQVTLVFGARDRERNNAVVLAEYLSGRL